jgi:hypothetical protein
MAMRVSIVKDIEGFEVWAQCMTGNPRRESNSLIIGGGRTRDEAVKHAVQELEETLMLLQTPPGVVKEWHG